MHKREGILLVNLGTPEAPTPGAVRAYLAEFLSDPEVIDLPAVLRWLLLRTVILPFRPRRSAEAYRKIWTADGSPLLVHSRALAARIRELLPGVPVELGMRYGRPTLEGAVARLVERGVERLAVVPLFPQESSSTTGTAVQRVRAIARRYSALELCVAKPFFAHPAFLRAFEEVARPVLARGAPEHVLFSFHGLPERFLAKASPSAGCLERPDCCAAVGPLNGHCYRAQCFATARELASRLGLRQQDFSVSFQSRLGRARWIQPYTHERLRDLARGGAKRVAVVCPAFVADCLETLEEIALRGREEFLAEGGEALELVPSLNDHATWAAGVVELVQEARAAEAP